MVNSCLRNVCSTLLLILPTVAKLKIRNEKMEFERIVLEKWNIVIREFPIHEALQIDDPGGISESGDLTSNEEFQRDDAEDNVLIDELQRDNDNSISESDEAIDNNELQGGDDNAISESEKAIENEFVTSESEDAIDHDNQNFPETPSTSRSRPKSTTPTSRERITRFPIDSPQLNTKRKGQSRRKDTERNPKKRRIKIQLSVEGEEGKECAFVEVGTYGIPFDNVVPKHRQFAELFKCTYCNYLIPLNGKIIECGHRYCSDCLDIHSSQSNDCFLRCGIEIKKSKKDGFTKEDERVHQYIDVFCTHCKTLIKKEEFTVHNDHCSHSVITMSEYMLAKTEALQMWNQLEEIYSLEEMCRIKKHILKKLQSEKPINHENQEHLLSSEEAGAFRQFLNISTRTYKRMHTWFKHCIKRGKVNIRVLPSYEKVLKADKKQMPCNVAFGIQDPRTRHITHFESVHKDFNPIDMKESYRQVDFWTEPCCAGRTKCPLSISLSLSLILRVLKVYKSQSGSLRPPP